jgi:hypothetical protein
MVTSLKHAQGELLRCGAEGSCGVTCTDKTGELTCEYTCCRVSRSIGCSTGIADDLESPFQGLVKDTNFQIGLTGADCGAVEGAYVINVCYFLPLKAINAGGWEFCVPCVCVFNYCVIGK